MSNDIMPDEHRSEVIRITLSGGSLIKKSKKVKIKLCKSGLTPSRVLSAILSSLLQKERIKVRTGSTE